MGTTPLFPRAERALGTLRRMSPRRWLLILTATYFVISLALSILRYVEIRTENWDLGIAMQALWSTNHGHLLYEAGDYETYGATTLLQVHTAFVLIAVAPLYDLAPSPVTLFILQSGVVALAAVPLYRLAALITGSSDRALLTTGLYLAWVPILSSNLYDVHLESLLPLELLTLFLLWYQGRYLWGALVAVVAIGTIEVTPILIFAMAVFFLLPPVRATLHRGYELWRSSGAEGRGATLVRHLGPALRRALGTPRVQASLGLAMGALVAYYGLRYLQFNAPALFLGHTGPMVSTDVGLTPSSLGLTWSNFSGAIYLKATYWLILFATLAFIPLRAPRSLVIVAPWILYTFMGSPSASFATLGQQYGFVAAAPMMIAFVYGLRDLPLPPLADSLKAWWEAPSSSSTSGQGPVPPVRPWSVAGRPSRADGFWTLALAAAVVMNLLGSPLDPLAQNTDLGNGYDVTYHIPAGYSQIQQVAGMVPSGATVLASDDLFPYVANDLNAYSLLWYPASPPVLPFNPSHLPTYIFLSEERIFAVPGWLLPLMFNSTYYGVRATVGASSSHEGVVYLFETGYRGPTTNLLVPPVPTGTYLASSMWPGPIGITAQVPKGGPSVVEGTANVTGLAWGGPGLTFPQGSYLVTFEVRASWDPNATEGLGKPVNPGPPPDDAPVLSLNVTGFGLGTNFTVTLPWSGLVAGSWENVTVPFSAGYPTLNVEFTGYQWNPTVLVQVEQTRVIAAG